MEVAPRNWRGPLRDKGSRREGDSASVQQTGVLIPSKLAYRAFAARPPSVFASLALARILECPKAIGLLGVNVREQFNGLVVRVWVR